MRPGYSPTVARVLKRPFIEKVAILRNLSPKQANALEGLLDECLLAWLAAIRRGDADWKGPGLEK